MGQNYNLQQDDRVIFAKDTDPQVRDKVYVVNFISPAFDELYDSTLKFNNLWNKTQTVGMENNISSVLALQNQLNHFSSACTPANFTTNLFVQTGLWGGVYEFLDALNGNCAMVYNFAFGFEVVLPFIFLGSTKFSLVKFE